MQTDVERPADATFVERRDLEGAIEFRNVAFHYPNRKENALDGVSFKIKPGEKVALIGRVGSGKSTIQRLAMGLFQPTGGAVLVDGIDLRQVDPADLRRNMGYVSQDVLLFYGSLRDNIAFGMPYAEDGAIVAAAEVAGLADTVNRHPHGFDMSVGERGESLSGGQRQSVGIARAVLHNAPMLLLDEPTSAMDYSSEAADHAAPDGVRQQQDRGAGDAPHLAADAGRPRHRHRRRQGGGRRPARPHHGSAAERPDREGGMSGEHDNLASPAAPARPRRCIRAWHRTARRRRLPPPPPPPPLRERLDDLRTDFTAGSPARR